MEFKQFKRQMQDQFNKMVKDTDYLSFKAQYPILSVAGWGCKPKPIGLITFRF